MKKMMLTLGLAFIATLGLYAQTEATTKEGKKVILDEDGTWKYVETSSGDTNRTKDSTLNCDCSKLVSTNTDKVTGKSTIGSKNIILVLDNEGKTGFSFYFLKSKNTLIFSTKAVGSGNCIDDDDKMLILFKDGTRTTIYNDADFNCKAKFTIYFGGSFGKKKQLELLKTKEIETIRVWTSQSYVQRDLTPKQSKELMNTIKCLTK